MSSLLIDTKYSTKSANSTYPFPIAPFVGLVMNVLALFLRFLLSRLYVCSVVYSEGKIHVFGTKLNSNGNTFAILFVHKHKDYIILDYHDYFFQ